MSLHEEILTREQIQLLPAIKRFEKDFGLVGGTAIALQIGHRESIDFDLFPKDPAYKFNPGRLKFRFGRAVLLGKIINEDEFELTFEALNVKVTFFDFGHHIPFTERLMDVIEMPNLLRLAAMKVYALGYRAKWKDYVDLYFILRDFHPLTDIIVEATRLFPEFNERLLREQLSYFRDVSYSESVAYKSGFEVPDEEIKKKLIEWSVS